MQRTRAESCFVDLFNDFCVPDAALTAEPEPVGWAQPPACLFEGMNSPSKPHHLASHASVEPASAAYKATAFIRELSGLPPVSNEAMVNAMAAAAAAVGSSLNQIVPSLPPGTLATSPFQGGQGYQTTSNGTAYPHTPAHTQAPGTNSMALPAPVPLGQVHSTGTANMSANMAVPAAPPAPPAGVVPVLPPSVMAGASGMVGPDGQVLSATQLGELELARQRAARAAAGRRQQLIAQKRAREASRAANNAAQLQQQQAQADAGRPAKVQAVQSDAGRRPRRAAAGVTALTNTLSALQSEEGDDSDNEDGAAEGGKSGDGDAEQIVSTGDPVKDARKLKRLLRNRVSAQQARERKKQYVTTLEDQVRQLQGQVSELQSALSSSEAQNDALRRIIRSMQQAGPAGGMHPHAAGAHHPDEAGDAAAAGTAAGSQSKGSHGQAARSGPGFHAGVPIPDVTPRSHIAAARQGQQPLGPAGITTSALLANSGNASGTTSPRAATGRAQAPGMCVQHPGSCQAAAQVVEEGSGTSSHPGPMAGIKMGDAALAGRRIVRAGEGTTTVAVSSRPCSAGSPDLAEVEAALMMRGARGSGAHLADEEDDCLVVPQAPPLSLLQAAPLANRMSPPRHSEASGSGSLEIPQSSY